MAMSASHDYEVTLGPAAVRVLRSLGDSLELAGSLRVELIDGPNAGKQFEFEFTNGRNAGYAHVRAGVPYTAVPLSFNGYTAVCRPMTGEELRRLREEQARPVAARGIYVLDILPAESAFSRPRTI